MNAHRLHQAGKVGRNLLLALWTLFALFPIFWMVLITFKSDSQMFNTTFLFNPTFENYEAVLFKTDYFKAFLDNIIVSAGAVLVSVLVGVPAAYALARFDFKKKEDLAFTILSFKFAPEILVILPLFMIYQKIGVYDTYFGLIWVYQLITMPLLIWVVRGYFEDISVEIEQAAKLDGYRWWEIFLKILLPLIKPGLVSSALLAFIFAWNSFTFPLLLT
ncbi:MAG: carbohydrate ABC transporter permease, partial [Sphaerochaetaceae bacterium]|nr:carbohydrate ABC transporter permease [Sphaerochaetaceae bacterium]